MQSPFLVVENVLLGTLLIQFLLVEAGFDDLHGGRLVAVLGLFVTAGHDDSGGNMGDADGAVVLLTCWPPAPDARNVSIRRSFSFTSISKSSSISGDTETEANEVCRRLPVSKGRYVSDGGHRFRPS